jgi:hypothetical protein
MEYDAETLNYIWDAIEESITEAANKQIPKKKVFNTRKNRRQVQKKKSHYLNHIIELQQIIRKVKKRKNQEVDEEERIEINSKLKDIGKDTEVILPKLHRQ